MNCLQVFSLYLVYKFLPLSLKMSKGNSVNLPSIPL